MIAIYFNTSYWTDVSCVFNAGSYAIGCLVNLTSVVNETIAYCVIIQRLGYASINNFSMCRSSNTTFCAGRYLVRVYDITKDGNISTLPAVVDEILFEEPTTIFLEPSLSCM